MDLPTCLLHHGGDLDHLETAVGTGQTSEWPEQAVNSKRIEPSVGDVVGLDASIMESDALLNAYSAARVLTAHHPTVTARVGSPEDLIAVVNSECWVLGIDDLLVADASLIPALYQPKPT
ncbi:GMC oxidoreductase [Streptomyces sp. NPDC005953]|uniref:GMC oxidoreductase n=1 Tax=Streptomyces sp. NPDC005953 TaxID=3156719 RepID=UPI0033C42BB4